MVRVVGVIRVIKVVGVVWADMVVRAARVISLDDTHLERIWFTWLDPSYY